MAVFSSLCFPRKCGLSFGVTVQQWQWVKTKAVPMGNVKVHKLNEGDLT